MSSTAPARPRAVLLGVQLSGVADRDFTSSLDELARLATTLGFEVVGRVVQRRARMAPGAVVGSGKLRELARWTGGTGVVPLGPRAAGARRRDESDDEDDARGDEPRHEELEAGDANRDDDGEREDDADRDGEGAPLALDRACSGRASVV